MLIILKHFRSVLEMQYKTKLGLLVATIAVTLPMTAMASDVQYKSTISAKAGVVQFNDNIFKNGTKKKALAYGVEYKGNVKIHDNHNVPFTLTYTQTSEKNQQKYEEYSANLGYKYDIPISDSFVLSPKVAVGHQKQKVKGLNKLIRTIEVDHTYVEAGVEALIGVADTWQIKPSVSYQKDIAINNKINKVKIHNMEKGNAVKVEVGINKQLDSENEFTFTPYYYEYQNKNKINNKKTKIKETGVKVSYTF